MAGPERTYYVTTPIYYVNDAPHVGHAYTNVACDALARFKRLDGYRVLFVTGTDEHGQKVEKSAREAGLDPLEFCDRVSENFRQMNRLMNVSIDQFIRTTEPRHEKACQALWNVLRERGEIYLGKFAGWYAVRDEAFYEEKELDRGKAPTGADVEWVEEENFFFRLSSWQEQLLAFYEARPDFIAPETRRNEVVRFVRDGLRDLSISRTSLSWGIRVPEAPKHVMYVWLDALTNYITATGYPNVSSDSFMTFWPADLHMVGKDILRFHCVYWPAFLLAAGLPVPHRVFAHGWWTVEGKKMSKSLGNFLLPNELVTRYGLDAVRYFMLRDLPFGSDGDFSHAAIIGRINGDLANDFGNLAQRVLSMIHRNCNAAIPEVGELTSEDMALLESARALLGQLRSDFDAQSFHRALEKLWRLVAQANRYVDATAPWGLRTSNPARMQTVLYVVAEAIRHLATLMQPVMPDASSRLLEQLGIPEPRRAFSDLSTSLVPGTKIPEPSALFPRVAT